MVINQTEVPSAAAAEPALQGTPSASESHRILIVDDERLNIRVLGHILAKEGYTVIPAESGEHALALYRETPCRLILLDVMLGGMDGFATCREFKREHGEACAPIIFITAKNGPEDIVEGFEAGATDYLPKPFHAREVAARVSTHLQNQLLAEQQKKLVAQLSAANAAKNRFLGMAAHDLRNPLASIRTLAEFLREDQTPRLTPGQLDLVDTIYDASKSMLTLVNELLDVAVIEAGELQLKLRKCNLADIIRQSVRLQNLEAASKGTCIGTAPMDQIAEVLVDEDKIRQVVDNLLSNAVKFSPAKSVVETRIFSGLGLWGLAVRDAGPGIPAGERHKLFTDFGRLSAQPTAGEKSTGLGLAICRKIVEAHHGTIEAINLPGRGCEFRVSLPAQ